MAIFIFLLSVSYWSLAYCESGGDRVIKLLALAPWPDHRESAGWDTGQVLLPAGRVAVRHVNNHKNVLSDYTVELIEDGHEACGLTETTKTLVNFVKYASTPPNGTVVAVLGLYCSTSSIVLAELTQSVVLKLSASNSPVFKTNSYPHFWRFLVSAGIYADMMIGLMDRFDWKRIAIVQDLETKFHSAIAEELAKKILASNDNKEVVYHGGMVNTVDQFANDCINGIIERRARIILVSATGPQTAKLLCLAGQRKMRYPFFLWIILDFLVSSIEDEAAKVRGCDLSSLNYILESSVLVAYFSLENNNDLDSLLNVSIDDYLTGYREELELSNISKPLKHDQLYAGLLYDQVWAIALALNDSLPKLQKMNIKINHFDQPQVTKIIEDSLSQVSFHGVTGYIRFTSDNEVAGSVHIYQVSDSLEGLLCSYEFNSTGPPCTSNYSFVNCSLSFDEFDDDIPVELLLLETPLVVAMFTGTGIVVVFITVIILLMVRYRNELEIKASSFSMNMLIFLGCYALCLSQVFSTIMGGIPIQFELVYSIICNAQVLMTYSSICLIFVTLFMQLFRINRIFHNKRLMHLGCIYNNRVLFIITLLLQALPVVMELTFMSIVPFKLQISETYKMTGSITVIIHQRCCEIGDNDKYQLIFRFIFTMYEFIFLILNVILASNTRNITHRQFRNAKTVNVFMVSTIVVQAIALSALYIMKKGSNVIRYADLIVYIESVLVTLLCQCSLFIPKIFSVIGRKYTK